jgi:tetratricopeptide (TPR) repeat protein
MNKKIILLSICCGCLFLGNSCSKIETSARPQLDTPSHHVANGNQFLKIGKIDDALREFTRAKELDHQYSPSYVGIALIYGLKKDYDKSLSAMEMASRFAADPSQQTNVKIGYMRLYTIGQNSMDENWLKRVEYEFENARIMAPDYPQAFFYMGMAYKLSNRLDEAQQHFAKVIEINKQFVKEAQYEGAAIRRQAKSTSKTSSTR